MSENESLYKLNLSAMNYFTQNGSARMILSPNAAEEVCQIALKNGQLVTVIEGGIWHDPQFEARLDCIWWGVLPPVSLTEAENNNIYASKYIIEMKETHSAFVITTVEI